MKRAELTYKLENFANSDAGSNACVDKKTIQSTKLSRQNTTTSTTNEANRAVDERSNFEKKERTFLTFGGPRAEG